MQTITIHAGKGGSGRTIAAMTLASGCLTAGKRVTVLDCTSEAGRSEVGAHRSTLQTWATAMEASCLTGSPDLSVLECPTTQQLEDNIARAKAEGCEIALVDTQAHDKDLQLAALDLADLIILPATGPWEARCSIGAIKPHFDAPTHIFGLVTEPLPDTLKATEVRQAFGNLQVLQSELPYSQAIADQIIHGDLTALASHLACTPDQPGFAEFHAAREACATVWSLTIEVLWALRGLKLEHLSPAKTYTSVKGTSLS